MRDKWSKNGFHIGLVGGRLQGMEAAYLAREAGYCITLIDRDPAAPALAMADYAYVFDVRKDPLRFHQLLSNMDAVLPVTENRKTLDFLTMECERRLKPLLHDSQAFSISSSKIRSNIFFDQYHIPAPEKFPNCRFPVIVKPSEASGSHGVQMVSDPYSLKRMLPEFYETYGDAVIETFHQGPSLSLEIISLKGQGLGYVVTELEFDDRMDCKRVYAPSRCCHEMFPCFEKMGVDIAVFLNLNGLMDIEVIVDDRKKEIVVLEIDARFPSQTPMAVYHATKINLLEEWVKTHVMNLQPCPPVARPGCALLEHADVSDGRLRFIGETRMLPLNKVKVWPENDFFGATAALSDYQEHQKSFKATLIFAGENWSAVMEKRRKCLERITQSLSLRETVDLSFSLPPN